MYVSLLTFHKSGEFWTNRHAMSVGSGQEHGGAICLWWEWLWYTFAVIFYETYEAALDGGDWMEYWLADGLSAFVPNEIEEDDWGVGLEFDDDDFEVVTSGIVGAGRKFWQIGSGQEYSSAWLLYPGEYYIEADDDWFWIGFWVIKLIRSDGTFTVVYTTDGFYHGA